MIGINDIISSVKNNRFIKKIVKIAQSMFILKLLFVIFLWIVAFIPTWVYLFVLWLLWPTTFWEGFAVACLFLIGIGWFQGLTIVFGTVLTLWIIFEDK